MAQGFLLWEHTCLCKNTGVNFITELHGVAKEQETTQMFAPLVSGETSPEQNIVAYKGPKGLTCAMIPTYFPPMWKVKEA